MPAWNGVFVYWIPLGMYGIWFIAASLNVLQALKRQSAHAPSSHRQRQSLANAG
ncbi:MAG: hypothetical protein ABW110_01820 [Steroidobacteraceae bacterium]